MKTKTPLEKARTTFTWIFGILIAFLLFFTEPVPMIDKPLFEGLFMLCACSCAAIGALGRAWASLFISGKKDQKLIQVGPYANCRNPLYFYSFVGSLGVGLGSETFTIPTVIIVMFIIYYKLVIKAEEKRLEELFGEEYRSYKAKTPCFFPKYCGVDTRIDDHYDVNPRIFRRRLFDCSWFVIFIGILELSEALNELYWLPSLFKIY